MSQPPRLGYVPALDGLRGVAILGVLLYHGYGLPGGFLGVDLFFVLSGFLITAILFEDSEGKGLSLLRFYRRRVRRLMPVAVTAIVFWAIISVGAATATGSDVRSHLLPSLFAAVYVENLAHFLHPPVTNGLGHFWSLSQEEQFYLVWPPLLAFALRRRVAFRWLAIGLGASVAAVVVHRFMLADDGWWRVYYAPDTRSDGMLLGCLAAVIWKMRLLRPGRGWSFVGPSALMVYGADVALLRHTSPHIALYGITVANVAAAAMIGSVIMARGALFSQLLSLAPLRKLGVISYGLYIWLPITALMTGVSGTLMLVLGVGVAALSYRFIERPFRRPPSERPESRADRGDERSEPNPEGKLRAAAALE